MSLKAQPLQCPIHQIVFSLSAHLEADYSGRRIGPIEIMSVERVVFNIVWGIIGKTSMSGKKRFLNAHGFIFCFRMRDEFSTVRA